MSDYISRETALTALQDPELFNVSPRFLQILRDLPAADVAPVVPCKGCEHAERYERTDGTAGYYCGHPQNTLVYGERWERVFKPVKKPDDFCSFGEPRGAKIGG